MNSSFDELEPYEPTVSNGGCGERYENKMTALISLRLYNKYPEFRVVRNLKAAGKFDDLVFVARDKEGNQLPTWFVQLKHKNKSSQNYTPLTSSQFTGKNNDFNISKYFISWKNLHIKPDETNVFFKDLNRAMFVIFTNADLHSSLIKSDEVIQSNVDNQLLSTNSGEKKIFQLNPFDTRINEKNDSWERFLSTFYLFTGQRSEHELDELVEDEIRKSLPGIHFSPADIEFMSGKLYNYLETMGNTPINHKVVYDNLKNFLFKKLTVDRNDLLPRFCETFLNDYRHFFQTSLKLFHVTFKAHISLLCTAAFQQMFTNWNKRHFTLSSNKMQDEFIQNIITYLTNIPDESLIFIIDCVGDKSFVLIKYIKELHTSNRNTTIILLSSTQNKEWTESISTKLPMAQHLEFICSQNDLLQASVSALTSKRIIFQGYKSNDMDMSIMTYLYREQEKTYYIGSKIKFPEEIFFVPQKLGKQIHLDSNVFSVLKKGIFVTSNIDIETLKYEFKSQSHLIVTRKTALKNIKKLETLRFIVLRPNDSEYWFVYLQEVCPNVDLHWIKKDNTKWQLIRTTNLKALIEFINPTKTQMNLKDFIENGKSKIKIISGESGMGKSTNILTIAEEFKRNNQDIWIIIFNLKNYTDLLKANVSSEEFHKEVLKIAAGIDKSTKLQSYYFEMCYETGKIIVILDEFDKIYNEKGLELLQALQKSPVKEIWITTKPTIVKSLQEKTNYLAFPIQRFSITDQLTYFSNFFADCSKIEQLLKSLDANLLEYFQIPRHTKAIADAFKNINTTIEINLVTLIGAFINEMIASEEKANHLEKLENLAVIATIPTFEKLNPSLNAKSIEGLKDFVNKNKETIRIVEEFQDRPKFVHHIFSDYLAAKFLIESEKLRDFIESKLLFTPDLQNIKTMIDMILHESDPLFEAVANKNLTSIQKNKNFKTLDRSERTALHLSATIPESETIISFLLKEGCDPLQTDSFGFTALHYACLTDDMGNIITLLAKDTYSKTVLASVSLPIDWRLVKACFEYDNLNVFLHLLDKNIGNNIGIDVLKHQNWFNGKTRGNLTFLHLGAYYNAIKILKYLLCNDSRDSKRASLNHVDSHGYTALCYAISEKNCKAFDLLLEHSTENVVLAKKSITPLVVETTLKVENSEFFLKVIDVIFKNKMELCDLCGDNLEMMTRNINEWMTEMFRKLLLKYDKFLELALSNGVEEILFICPRIPLINSKLSSDWQNLLCDAITNMQVNTVEFLILKYRPIRGLSSLSSNSTLTNCLFEATKQRNYEMLICLTKLDVDLRVRTCNGNTLFHAMAESVRFDYMIFDLLQKSGVDKKAINNLNVSGEDALIRRFPQLNPRRFYELFVRSQITPPN